MGYDFMIRVAVNNPEEFEQYATQVKHIYDQLCHRPKFPYIGKVGHTGSGGYGCGRNDDFIDELTLFTQKFPEYTFIFYYAYWDFTGLFIIQIKNKTTTILFEGCETEISITPECKVYTSYDEPYMNIDNEITSMFGDD